MTKKRNRTRPALSLQERLNKFTQDARAAAKKLPAGTERHTLLQKARDGEAAAEIERLLSSPGSQHQK
jgi:DNA transposition AAA+ family ATPase